MSADNTALIIPAHGTVFIAPANTKPPQGPLDPSTGFNLQVDGPTPWINLGHTSKDNAIAFTKEGGDKTSLDTFLADSVRVATDSVSWGFTVNTLQMDKATLDLAFNGEFDPGTGGYTVASQSSQNVAVFLLFQDSTASLGFWLPNVDLSLGDAPSVDPSAFFEVPLVGSILAALNSVIPAVKGRAGLFQIFRTGLTSKGAATPGSTFPAEATITASDATNAGKLAAAGFVASPTSKWATGQKITVGTFDFNWTGTAWAAGAAS